MPLRRLSRKTVQDDSDIDFPEPALASTATGNALEESLDTEGAKNRNTFQRADMKKLSGNRRRCMDSLRPLKSSLDEKTEDYKKCFYSSDSSAIRSLNSSLSEFEGCKDEETRNSCLERFESVEELRKTERKYSHLFATAMAVGILSATSVWKTEIYNLNEQLKYMQNLVQDLQEELDMKEMIMVKNLTRGDGGKSTPVSIEEPIASPIFDVEIISGNNKYNENLELLSKIEVELQAELEMLENMEGSGVVELNPDADSEEETTKTNHSQPANYSVPPWELSFRLHELIESRLQMRIDELETALSYSQNRDFGRNDFYSDAES